MKARAPGHWLRAQRERRGWTQPQLAALLRVRSYVTVSDWERGRRLPGWSSVLAISDLFGVEPEEAARQLGWEPAPGGPCPCGCGGTFIPPRKSAGGPNECRVDLPCQGCGRLRSYVQGVKHFALCLTCSNQARTGVWRKVPRVVFRCMGYLDFGRVRHSKGCASERQFTPGEIGRYAREGLTINEADRMYRCFACTRAANILRGSDRFLESAYEAAREERRRRGEPKLRIQSSRTRREVRSALMKREKRPEGLPQPSGPPPRRSARHSPEARERLRNLYNAWRKPGGPSTLFIRLCRSCGRLLMVEKDQLEAAKPGLYHRFCYRQWQRQLGKARPELLGRATRLPVPTPGRRGRVSRQEELTAYFRWAVMYHLGRLLGEEVSERTIARQVGEETGVPPQLSNVHYGINRIVGLLPPVEVASKKLRPYLLALLQAVGKSRPAPAAEANASLRLFLERLEQSKRPPTKPFLRSPQTRLPYRGRATMSKT